MHKPANSKTTKVTSVGNAKIAVIVERAQTLLRGGDNWQHPSTPQRMFLDTMNSQRLGRLTLFKFKYTARSNPAHWDIKIENKATRPGANELSTSLDVFFGLSEAGVFLLDSATNEVVGFHPLCQIVNHRCRPQSNLFYFLIGSHSNKAQQKLHVFQCDGAEGYRVSEFIEMFKHGPLFRADFPEAEPMKHGDETWL